MSKRSFFRLLTRVLASPCLIRIICLFCLFCLFLCVCVSLFATPSLLPSPLPPLHSLSLYRYLSLPIYLSICLSHSHSRRVLLLKQWGALAMLAIGVGLVQVSTANSKDEGNEQGGSDDRQDALVGLAAVLMACCTSGFAGVYFEKVTLARTE